MFDLIIGMGQSYRKKEEKEEVGGILALASGWCDNMTVNIFCIFLCIFSIFCRVSVNVVPSQSKLFVKSVSNSAPNARIM